MSQTHIVKRIDKAIQDRPPEKRRGHLGASAIGAKCARQIWYGFRWAWNEKHQGRMLRLFKRGHDEEFSFVSYLREAGAEVQDYSQRLGYHEKTGNYVCIDWEVELPPYEKDHCIDVSQSEEHIKLATAKGQGPKQWGFTDHDGHFSGSSDGRIRWPDVLPEGWGLQEFKTHSEKSFVALAGALESWRKHVTDPQKNPFTGKGVLTSKPQHYQQMQVYMHQLGLKWALYVAVCKNTDDLYTEIIYYKEEVALYLIERAKGIIGVQKAPPKLTQDPSWFECKFCAFREICHYAKEPQVNCRSCSFATPVADGRWRCNKFDAILPEGFVEQACQEWVAIE